MSLKYISCLQLYWWTVLVIIIADNNSFPLVARMVREVGVFQFSSKFLSDVNNSNSNLDSRRLGWYLPSSWISTWTINHSSQMNLDGSVPEISKWYLGTCSHHFLTFLWHVANLTSSDQWPDTELVKTFTLRRCKCWKCFPSCSPPNWVSQWVSGWCF